MAELVYFPPELLALQEEVLRHPKLLEVLDRNPEAMWQDKIALVCLYCNLAIDKVFSTDKEIADLCDWLIMQLREMNRVIAVH